MVKRSERYMASGSSDFSPSRKGKLGVAGMSSASQRMKAAAYSRRMSVRARCALR